MNQSGKAQAFRAMHVKGAPVVLFNIWDAGSAKTVAEAGAKALATGSAPLAAAQGYADGEVIPLDLMLTIVARIAATVELPLSVDAEGGYATAPAAVAETMRKIIAAGAIGVNFEDRIVGGTGLHPVALQAQRIAAIRAAGDAAGVPLVINARTDLFLASEPSSHAGHVEQALARAAAYADAGADCFFVPGLKQPDLIARICAGTGLPVNLLRAVGGPPVSELAALGAARISHGPFPYRDLMAHLGKRFQSESGGPA